MGVRDSEGVWPLEEHFFLLVAAAAASHMSVMFAAACVLAAPLRLLVDAIHRLVSLALPLARM